MMIVIRKAHGLLGDADKIRALNNILMACGEAKHILWMPAKEIDSIIDGNVIFGYQLNVLVYVREQSRLAKAQVKNFDFHVEVDFDNITPPHYVAPGKLVVSYSHFLDSARVQPPVFVCENLSDIDFYILGAKARLHELKLLSEYDLKFEKVGGGGNTTVVSFEYHLNNEKLVVCVLDSDREHPKAAIKETAARFDPYDKGWGRGYWLHILDCTEAENLVPWKIAEEALHRVGNNAARDQFLALTPETRQYLDHKEGLKYTAALLLDKDKHGKHWSNLLDGDPEDDYWICQPLGSTFLDRCITIMQEMSIMKLYEMLDSHKDQAYIEICSMIASWGICYKKKIR
jgi:hypothetical protein